MLSIRQLADYRVMMMDRVRMDAYRAAINVVCPGKVVCEIGVGLGPLSLMALQAGALRVYGVEVEPSVLDAASAVMQANGYGDRFIPVRGLSEKIRLPEKVDVIVSDTFDCIGIGESTARYMADARHRFLVPGGVCLPSRLECHLALAHPEAYLNQLDFWRERMSADHGMDFSAITTVQPGAKHAIEIRQRDLCSELEPWLGLQLGDQTGAPSSQAIMLKATRSGPVSGLATVFDATLCDGVHLRTFPSDPITHWKQGFQPLPEGWIDVEQGQRVYVEVHVKSPPGAPRVVCELVVASGSAGEMVKHAAARRRANPSLRAAGSLTEVD